MLANGLMRFIRHRQKRSATRKAGAFLWVFFCLAFVVFILGIMLLIPGIQVSVYAIPVWLLVMWVCYNVKGKRSAAAAQASS